MSRFPARTRLLFGPVREGQLRIKLALMVVAIAGAPAALAQQFDPRIPDAMPRVDPLDPASCDVEEGWQTVMTDLILKMDDGRKNGRLKNPLDAELSTWVLQQQNRIAAGDDIRRICLDFIAIRKQVGI